MLGQRPATALISLVDELRSHSARFRQLWAQYDVTQEIPAVMLINHPQQGPLDLNYQQMLLPGTGHWLVTYWAEPGSTSETGLRRLASS